MACNEQPIQLFAPSFRVEECLEEIRETLEKGWTGLGYKTLEIESAWKTYTGVTNAHFVNSATAALHLSLAVLKEKFGWDEQDEVITTALTFVSTNHVILETGLTPIFADVDEYLCLDPSSVESAITNKTRAVIFVGIGGNTGQLERVIKIARKKGLILILDAAHMSGTKLGSLDPGNLVDVACYSFQAVKNLPTADSGMVCFADGELDAIARKMSWLGISKDTYSRASAGNYAWKYDVEYVGFKYNGNSVMAAMALVGLKYLDQDNARRREIAFQYATAIAGFSGVTEVPTAPNCTSSRHLFQVRVSSRADAIETLQRHNIFPGVHYTSNTEYVMYKHFSGSVENAEKASKEILSLPMHVQMNDRDVERVIAALHEYSISLVGE